MCGIAGIISTNETKNNIDNLLVILKNLINRGKNGTGIAFFDNQYNIQVIKKEISPIQFADELKLNEIDSKIVIGHVRNPTIGEISEFNTQPILDCSGNMAVIHNGTIFNHKDLRKKLINSGHKFNGTVDSEVLPHLIEENYKHMGNLKDAVELSVRDLKGYYTFAVISSYEPDQIILYVQHFPLIKYERENFTIFCSEREPLTHIIPNKLRIRNLKENKIFVIKNN
ncbi:MAG: hypothetical protein EAX96_19900 [Candidatus Lokiarchaeota archaeon]|nr:hypothetical protein [Candidatus Lokiarchaeota archaeon]